MNASDSRLIKKKRTQTKTMNPELLMTFNNKNGGRMSVDELTNYFKNTPMVHRSDTSIEMDYEQLRKVWCNMKINGAYACLSNPLFDNELIKAGSSTLAILNVIHFHHKYGDSCAPKRMRLV